MPDYLPGGTATAQPEVRPPGPQRPALPNGQATSPQRRQPSAGSTDHLGRRRRQLRSRRPRRFNNTALRGPYHRRSSCPPPISTGATPSSSASGQQDTLTTSLIPFNPGDLFLRGDQNQNLSLNSGDVVTFFSTADIRVPTAQQTRFVRLEGEFNASGTYSVLPGETLRQLLRRVGGFTPSAYLYGSEFTRLSTRRVQQQRLNEYADNLDAQISAQSAASNAHAVSALDTAATTASNTQTRQTITRLRQLVPIGRIVLDLLPDSRSVDDIPDLALEDGDRFVVPRTPATVSVEGQVYSANAFVFERGRKERDYMRQAGGPDRQSDSRRTFILRADGSVYSQQYGNVARATMFPGDTIVVPPKLTQRALLRNLLDASTIIGQFGLGAAAIDVLR